MKNILKVVFIIIVFSLIAFICINAVKQNKIESNKENYDGNILENNNTYNNYVEINETDNLNTKDAYVKNPDLVNLEITKYDLENNNLTLTITDLNEIGFQWIQRYAIEKKNDNIWEELERVNPEKALLISSNYDRNEKNQVNFYIYYNYDYGKLEPGIYRVVKESEGNVFYSNEFEVNN